VSDHSFCPYYQQAVELIGRRWCGAIARALLGGPLRFSELERAIPEISARALAHRLRELEAAKIVTRQVEPAAPVRVSYELTERGRALEGVVTQLERWAHRWLAPRGHRHTRGRPGGESRRPRRLSRHGL
jgi:DNA-binding HxlR family transcriptional regulator